MVIEVKAYCKDHGTDVSNGRCEQCLRRNIENYEKTFAGMSVSVAVPSRMNIVSVNGQDVEFDHGWDYFERGIPNKIYDEVKSIVESKIAEFENTCMCFQCQKKRG